MYFLGVTTARSSIHQIFPRWSRLAGIPDAGLAGIDIPLDAPPAAYRSAVERMLADPDSRGALVTSHKVALWSHARDLFASYDADAALLGEASCLVQRNGRIEAIALDTLTSGLALRPLLEGAPFRGSALILGAGGAGLALAVHLHREHQPQTVILTDVSAGRLALARQVVPAQCQHVNSPQDNDRVLALMPEASLIVNATGMGKDRPGSPLTAAALFPARATAWDFNYRGSLVFLDQARRQRVAAVDGWEYFLHGWSRIMARVFGFDLTPELFAAMRAAAEAAR